LTIIWEKARMRFTGFTSVALWTLGRYAGAKASSTWDGTSGLILSKDLPAQPSQSLPPAPKESKKEGKRNSGQSDWAAWVRERNDPRIAHTKPEALDDITVLDLSYKSYAGSYCSSMLSEFGARVLRIEPPEGDFLRSCTPGGMLFHGEGLNYLTEGRNKFHITLNLNMPEGREILQNLARHADVLIETFQPGTMESWGIGCEHLKVINPKLIFSSLSAFGQFGPLSRNPMPDYDSIAQARSGIQWATGEIMPENKSYDDCPWAVPTKAGPWVAWGLSAHSWHWPFWRRCTTEDNDWASVGHSLRKPMRALMTTLYCTTRRRGRKRRFGNLDVADGSTASPDKGRHCFSRSAEARNVAGLCRHAREMG
jgi:hypothetical protein